MAIARLIWDGPASGPWNMAVDEALLRSATETHQITLRLYEWCQPTLSLGYFQAARERQQHLASRSCPMVRRVTGGGAIVHDRELTYSLVLPWSRVERRPSTLWYDRMHEALIHTFASFGVSTYLCPATNRALEKRFLCFQRRAQGDILLDCRKMAAQYPNSPAASTQVDRHQREAEDIKIVGSAQRRWRDALVQHGSILLDCSSAAPELPGVAQYLDVSLDATKFGTRFVERLERSLALAFSQQLLTTAEQELAHELYNDRFGTKKWTLKR